jgi:hypothetical protein
MTAPGLAVTGDGELGAALVFVISRLIFAPFK